MAINYKKLEHEQIQKLKIETKKGLGPKVEINEILNYKLRIINRGEQLFYQENDRAFICQMNPYNYLVDTTTIKNWDNNEKITSEEKSVILERIKAYFKKYHSQEVGFI